MSGFILRQTYIFGEHPLFYYLCVLFCFVLFSSDADYQVMATHKTYSIELKIGTWTSF